MIGWGPDRRLWGPRPKRNCRKYVNGLRLFRTWSHFGAVSQVRVHKQQVSAFLLRHARIFPRRKSWGARYRCWLQQQYFEHPADQIVLQEYVEAVRIAEERVVRIERAALQPSNSPSS